MPPDRRRNALDQARIEATMPGEKDIRLYDGEGLHLLITPNGARYWRFKYWYEGKPKSVSAGVFPTVSLAQVSTVTQLSSVAVIQFSPPAGCRQLTDSGSAARTSPALSLSLSR